MLQNVTKGTTEDIVCNLPITAENVGYQQRERLLAQCVAKKRFVKVIKINKILNFRDSSAKRFFYRINLRINNFVHLNFGQIHDSEAVAKSYLFY